MAAEPPKSEVVRCSYVVPNKGRRCRFPVLPGTARCGAHREDEDDGARIPCPLDPNHTVFERRLKQHLKVCTKVRDRSVVERQPFYHPRINLPTEDTAASASAPPVSAAGAEVVRRWMARIEGVWPKAVEEVLGRDISEQILEWSVVAHGDGLAHAEKHEAQNQALAELMLKDRQLSSCASQVVVEFGSGKGGLAAAVLRLCSARCVLVEREPRRHKFENKQDAREKQVLRLRLDIADFDLGTFLGPKLGGGLPKAADLSGGALSVSAGTNGPAERLEELWRSAAAFQEAGPWPPSSLAACAKHLCGGATDVALRSLQACPRGQGLSVCVATCCHHRCDPDSYVNRRFLERLGLCDSAEDFRQFVSTAGWAVGGERDLQKKRVGMMSKRILDLGRVAWLREELGLEAAIREYISKAVTPENVVITGRRADAFKASRPARTLLRCLPWCC